ncbi:glutamate ABC transporter substrate-binding protein [Kineosporia babensis]|uniref:Glutamate ABC transporter substrate-binding protein n=1 Tax=Kineosporia babensis TaxID=499548 RepID=A0A9X1NG76_9ACTN|nr:glutamate ABC transporter substrate-binding protein [Kineosporia babensis]MCD5313538.1 glutamate ABC transporter substrate-binding protein [Kineosporia babensis]
MNLSKRALTATAAGVLLLAGCGAAPTATIQAQPAAAVLAATEVETCSQDGLSATASFAPDGISTNPSSWSDESTMGKIRKSGKLVVGVAGDVKLWGSRNSQTGQLEGFDIDVLKRIATEIGPGLKIEYKVINFAERQPALIDGDVQLVAHTMTMTCPRWFDENAINFSTEYYRAGQKVLVRSDSKATTLADLEGQKICAATGSTSLANLKEQGGDPLEVSDVGDCLVKFQEGEVIAITSDDTVLAGFAAQDPYAEVKGEAITEVPYGVGIAPDDVEFTQFVNAVLEEMRSDGTLQRLTDKYMAGTGELPAVPKAVYGRKVDGR